MPDGKSYSYAYDDAGNVTGSADPNGTVVAREYDAEGRLVRESAAKAEGIS